MNTTYVNVYCCKHDIVKYDFGGVDECVKRNVTYCILIKSYLISIIPLLNNGNKLYTPQKTSYILNHSLTDRSVHFGTEATV